MKKLYDEAEVLNYANAAYAQAIEAAAKVADVLGAQTVAGAIRGLLQVDPGTPPKTV